MDANNYWFLVGFSLGILATIFVIVVVCRAFLRAAAHNKSLSAVLMKKLASVEAQKLVYEQALNDTVEEVTRLRDEKLHAWGIPDGMGDNKNSEDGDY